VHIPEGYLGPQTYGAAYAVMLPIWATAGRVVQRSLSARKVPLLAIGAAFSFVVMMFNVPIPGGTTGHATGGALSAILLGPWAAVIALSVVLAVQAFVFQDGGITALGANCFNMAFVLPFTAYGVYRLLSIRAAARSTRRVVATGIAGYVGLNAAALTAAVMLGIQPMIAHAADGRPLYSPFGLGVAVPVMAAGHLLVFGFVEGIITALAFSYLAASDPGLVAPSALPGRPRYRRLAWGLAILALLTPLGIWLPQRLGASGAWGEWGPAELAKKVGFVPQYLDRLSHLWKAPIPDYAPRGWAARPFTYQGLAYILSALIGIAVCAALLMMLSRWLVRTSRMGHDSGVPPPGAGRAPDAETTRDILPDWVSLPTSPRAGRDRGRSRFVDRSLRESARVLQDSVFAERVARSPGFLQSLDARVKLVSLLALLIAATLLHHLVSLWLFGVCVAAMAALSRVPARVLFSRVWWLLPATFVIVALPAALNVITPGDSLVALHRWSPNTMRALHLPPELSITRQGLAAAGMVVTRVFLGVLLAVTLALTTRWQEALRAIYTALTAHFVLILAMTHRYLFVLLRTFDDMHLARKSRTITPGSAGDHHRWIGGSVAALFASSKRLSEDVYQAMLSRGYRGRPRAIVARRIGAAEIAWLGGCSCVVGAAFLVDRVLAAGLPW